LLNEEHSESTREEEGKTKEPHREESETSGTAPTIEVSTINPHVFLVALSNQSSHSYQRTQSTITNSLVHTQSGNLGRSMADDMRLPIFKGYGSEDPDQNDFLFEVVWSIKNVPDEAVKRAQFSTTPRDCTLSWYMKFFQGIV
jgi:hypothetical protein